MAFSLWAIIKHNYANKQVQHITKYIMNAKKSSLKDNIIYNSGGNLYWKDLHGKYLGCNKTYADMIGLKEPNEIIGKSDRDLYSNDMSDDQLSIIERTDQSVMREAKEMTCEEIGVDQDRRLAYYITKKIPLRDEDKNIIGLIGTSINISAQKKLEKLRKHNQEICRRNKEMSKQISILKRQAFTIAHELRTPIGSITNCASSLDLIADRINDPEIKQDIMEIYELINKESQKTNGFIDIILQNLTDLEHIAIDEISINECINEAISRYPYETGEREKVTFKTSADFIFRGEKEIIIHVIFNLIKNALYFIQEARKGDIIIWTEVGEKFNRVHFKDTAKGIEQTKIDKIFKEFYTDTGIGTGIGLYFCKQAMKAFQGDIVCEAKLGQYTHFILSFPKVPHREVEGG